MPEDDGRKQEVLGNMDEDAWRRAMILLESCTEDELLDKSLDSNNLLVRLFHEEGVRVYDRKELKKGCRCDVKRVENILYTMNKEDVDYMDKDGAIEMVCEFCSTAYKFDTKEVLQKIKK